MSERYILKKHELDFVGSLFGLKLESTTYTLPYEALGKKAGELHHQTLVHLYIEDDEDYIHEASFDSFWLKDLYNVVDKAIISGVK